jgi:molybdopterin-guanine dinucleotide biosynthesis protein A
MRIGSISALILAGGRATRMGGIPKHEIVVGGETILTRQRRALRYFEEILVSSPIDIAGVRTVRDAPEHEGIGPLAGIAAGLAATRWTWLFVVAGDMPDLSLPLIGHLVDLVDHAGRYSEADHRPTWENVHAIGVKRNDLPEPLFSVLRVSRAREVVLSMIEAREYKASKLLDALHARYASDERLRELDPGGRALRNINEPGDIGD